MLHQKKAIRVSGWYFLSKPQAWYGITPSGVYGITRRVYGITRRVYGITVEKRSRKGSFILPN